MESTLHSNLPAPSGGNHAGDGALGRAVIGAHGAVNTAAKAADDTLLKAKPVIDRVAESTHQAITKAAGVVAPTAEWLKEQTQNVKVTQQKLLTDARTHVTAHPLKALLIALVMGLLVGRLMR